MIVKKYRAEIISIVNSIDNIYTIEFGSLNGKFKYIAGQFLHIALDPDYDGSGQWPESRCFSMQTSPSEATIKITYAVKGRFTQLMAESLKVGSEAWLKLPFGDLFTQPHNKNNTVFIAGGTGITPYLSLFTHESFSEYINPKLYLGLRSKEYNIYQTELGNSCNSSKFVNLIYQDTKGILDINVIFEENKTDATYFISGPPVMIKTFKQTLINKGVPANQVLTDDWE